MNKDTQQNLKEYFETIPSFLQEIITSREFSDKLDEIAEEHNLTEAQNTAFQNETILVVMGIEDSEDYLSHLENIPGVSSGQSTDLAQKTTHNIFLPLEKLLKEDSKKKRGNSEKTRETQNTHENEPSSSQNPQKDEEDQYEGEDPYREPEH